MYSTRWDRHSTLSMPGEYEDDESAEEEEYEEYEEEEYEDYEEIDEDAE